MRIAVVVLNFNGQKDTEECLKSLKVVAHPQFKVDTIVVDNASSDNSVSIIKQKYPYVTILTNDQNLGYAEGNNVGIRYALAHNADFIFILNNDTTVSPDILVQLLKVAEEHKHGGIFGPKIYFYPGCETHQTRYKKGDLGHVLWYAGGKIDWNTVIASHRGVDEVDTHQYDEVVRTSFVTGCAMFVRSRVFESIGFFDKKFYLYYEDVDFCQKARLKKFDAYYVPNALVWHKNAHSSGGAGSQLHIYYMTRNRMLVGMRHASWKTRLALMREAMLMLMRGTGMQKQAVGDFLRKKYGRQETNFFKFPSINLVKLFKRQKQN